MTGSAEGRVENQKLNQTAALLSFGWVFGFQLKSLEKNLFTLAVVTFIPFSQRPSNSSVQHTNSTKDLRIAYPDYSIYRSTKINYLKVREDNLKQPNRIPYYSIPGSTTINYCSVQDEPLLKSKASNINTQATPLLSTSKALLHCNVSLIILV